MRLDRLLNKVRKFVPAAGSQAEGTPRKVRKTPPGRIQLGVEALEERLAPIIGSLSIPATVARGTFYDGVVALSGCTGSLLSSGRHILTAAHCTGGSNQVRFDMIRGSNSINIFNNVPAGTAFQTDHPSYNGDINRGFDVSVLRLTDQEPGFTGIANRHLVAPFGATRYDLYRTTNEANQIVTIVGYGNTGTGATGQTGGSGVKRLGYNHIAQDGTGWMAANQTTGILSDFDDGTAAANTLNDPFWTTHPFECSTGQGDSGGPGFINNQIAAVHSGIYNIDPPPGLGSYRDVQLYARVSTLAGFVDGQVAGSYHLVLDMNQQVLGLDGLTENVTITAQRVGANIQLSVSAPAFSGVYYTAPASQILSLTVRGSSDHETINLEAGLGVGTTVVGRGGNDTINVRGVSSATTMTVDAGIGNDIINVGNAGSVATIQGTLIVNGGTGGTDTFNYLDQNNSFSDTYNFSSSSVGRTASSIVSYSNMEAVNVNAGTGNNTINVTSTAAGVVTTINAGSGNDIINVSSSTLNLTQIAGNLSLQSGPGTDTLNINDQNNGLNHTYTMTGSSGSGSLQRTSAGLVSFSGFNGGLTVRGGSGTTTFFINGTHIYATTVLSGTGVNATTVRATSGLLTIQGQSGLDTVNVGSTTNTLAAILGAITVANSGSYTTLILNDQGTTATRTATMTNAAITGLAPVAINYTAADLRQLTVNAGSGGNTFHVLSTPLSGSFLGNIINSGAGGDTVNVRATTGALTVNGGNGNDAVTVGSGGAGSTINAILGAVTVNGQANSDTLIVDDRGNAVSSTYTITATTVSRTGGPATITYGTMEFLTLFTGSSTINVPSTAAGVTTTVQGGPNADTFNVGGGNLDTIQGPLTLLGNGGIDTVTLNDASQVVGRTITMTATTVARSGAALVTYGSAEGVTFNAGGGGDTVNVQATAAGTPVTVNAGGGNDTVNVGSAANMLAGLLSNVAVNGQGDADALNINDLGSPGGHSYTVNAASVTRDGVAGAINYGTLEGVTVNGATAGGNAYYVADTAAGTPVAVAGSGSDFLARLAGSTVFSVTATDAGTLTGDGLGAEVTFSGCANLGGGAGDDVFAFADGVGVNGIVVGGTGYNTLDYTFWSTGVYVDLAALVASNIAGGVGEIVYVFGGAGDDYLHGDAQDNWIVGNGGHDILIGADGHDWLQGGDGNDLIFAGNGFDQLDGGTGDDLLIDGPTLYDDNTTATGEIYLEWAYSGNDYATRIANLRAGTPSGYVLDATTVFTDADVDLLFGEDDQDWFWGLDGFDVMDRIDPDEVLN